MIFFLHPYYWLSIWILRKWLAFWSNSFVYELVQYNSIFRIAEKLIQFLLLLFFELFLYRLNRRVQLLHYSEIQKKLTQSSSSYTSAAIWIHLKSLSLIRVQVAKSFFNKVVHQLHLRPRKNYKAVASAT